MGGSENRGERKVLSFIVPRATLARPDQLVFLTRFVLTHGISGQLILAHVWWDFHDNRLFILELNVLVQN